MSARMYLVVEYDVTDLTPDQRGLLEGEATVQAEATDGDGFQEGKPDVPVTSRIVIR
jgi:hypothetical protein